MKKIAVAFFLSLISVSCSKDSNPNYYGTIKPKHPFDEIWINNREEPQYTDPTLCHGTPDGLLVQNTFYRLVSIDPKTGKPVPELAESWDVSSDGKTYVFHMRKGLQWSDGESLTAGDVEYSWKRLMNPDTGAEYQGIATNVIENGDAYGQRAIHITGFAEKIPVRDVMSYFVKHDVPVLKIQEQKDSSDVFVFVKGETGEETQQNRETIMKLLMNEHPWGENVKGQVTDASVVGVNALDALTLEVKLVGPLPYFISLIEFYAFSPLPKHVIEKFKAEGKEDQWTKPENVVVSGPFKLKEEKFKQFKIYEKNPKYWDASNVRLNRVKILMIEKESASLNSYKVGEIDWIGPHEVPSEQVANVKNFKDFHNDPYLGVYYYFFNTQKKPLDDVRVRQALGLAIDRQQIAEHILAAGQMPYAGIVPDGLAGYKSYSTELFNPQKAKQLLADAGYPDGKNFPRLKFVYDTKEVHRLVIQAIQEMWKQNLNIDIEPSNVEWKIYLDRMQTMQFELTRLSWIGDFLDPYTFLELLKSTSGNNHTGWSNAEYDRLLEASNVEPNDGKRLELLGQAEKIAIDEAPFLPIYLYSKAYMLKPYVKGFYPDYQDHHAWKHMWIDLDWSKK